MQITCQRLSLVTAFAVAIAVSTTSSFAQSAKKPNILVIFGDDIGITNLSAYTHGLVGYHTPNIDQIAKEGTMFTDYYGESEKSIIQSAPSDDAGRDDSQAESIVGRFNVSEM